MLRWANRLAGLLLGSCALLQLNDPDPARWLLIYGVAASLCVLSERKPRRWKGQASWALLCAGWAITLLPEAMGVRPEQLVQSMQAGRPAVEAAREAGGLLLVAGWMVVLVRHARKTGS